MSPLLDELVTTVPPPQDRSAPFQQWEELESRLGVPVPEDYKAIVEAYGPGCFDEFLHVLQPKSHYEAVRIIGRAKSFRQRLQAQLDSGRTFPYAPNNLLAAAVTEDGDLISWIMEPRSDTSKWKIVAYNFQTDEWNRFDGGLLEFLNEVYRRRLRMPFFPDDFPLPQPEFKIYPTVEEARLILDKLTEDGVE